MRTATVLKMTLIIWTIMEFYPFFKPDLNPHPVGGFESKHLPSCENRHIVKLHELDPYFPGEWVKCEDFDAYFDAMERADKEGAKKFVLTDVD